jgi:hypothetical protein
MHITRYQLALTLFSLTGTVCAQASCDQRASPECLQSFQPDGMAGRFSYYASRPANTTTTPPTQAIVALHGHPRDANRSFDATLMATRLAAHLNDTLVIAPIYQVTDPTHCHTDGVPDAQDGEFLWTCESWLQGEPARNAPLTSFAALDALLKQMKAQWPSLQRVTLAGFSAGAQMVQHYIGFARPPANITVRYLVADPGTWLYFDPIRPAEVSASSTPGCPQVNLWKYGTDELPGYLGRSAREARQNYAAADIRYLEGERDTGTGKGSYYGILDKSCAANAQGAYRLQRGQAYADYDQSTLKTGARHPLVIVPACTHDVACVFPSAAGQAALFADTP